MKKTINQSEIYYRASYVDEGAVDEENRSADVAFSSEASVERFFGLEVLGHEAREIDLSFIGSGNAPLLLDHDTTKIVGVVEEARVSPDGKARAKVRFGRSALADETFRDVLDGIRRNISVGYRISEFEVKPARDGEELDTVRATLWKPFEISLVSIPADESVGVGREYIFEDKKKFKEENLMNEKTERQEDREAPKEVEKVNVDAVRSEAIKGEQARVADILALGNRFNMVEAAEYHIRNGKNVEEFKDTVLEEQSKRSQTSINTVAATELGMEEKEVRSYSLMRAIRACGSGDWSNAGLEKEASDAVAKNLGRHTNGFFVPREYQTRDLTAGGAATGAELVGTDHLGGSFIDALRNKLVVRDLGAQFLTGLQGNVEIPKLTASANTFWVAENTAGTEQTPATGNVTLSPNTITSYVDMSRRLMLQSDPSVEAMVRNDLVQAMAIGIDTAAIAGSGAGNEPTGILNTVGIGAAAGAGANGDAPTWDLVNQLVELVEVANAGDSGKYLTNPKVVSKLRRTPKVASTDSVMIMNTMDDLMGYEVHRTNSVPSNLVEGTSGATLSALIYGNWMNLLVGEWGVIELIVDPFSQSTTGATRLSVLADVDVAVRHAVAFSAAQDIITT